MTDSEIENTLQRLAHAVVRNEIVGEHFMTQERPATADKIAKKEAYGCLPAAPRRCQS